MNKGGLEYGNMVKIIKNIALSETIKMVNNLVESLTHDLSRGLETDGDL